MEKVKVTSDGLGTGTFVTYKGETLPVKKLTIEIESPGHFARATLEVPVEFDMELFPALSELIREQPSGDEPRRGAMDPVTGLWVEY